VPKIVKPSTPQGSKIPPKSTGGEKPSVVKSQTQSPTVAEIVTDVVRWAKDVKALFGFKDGERQAEHSMLHAIGTKMSLYDRDQLLNVLRIFKDQETI